MLLVLKIMEKAPLGQPRRRADLIDRSGGVALGQHQLLGGIEQLLPGRRVGLGFAHSAYLPVGMRIPVAVPLVKPVFREPTRSKRRQLKRRVRRATRRPASWGRKCST